MTFLCITKHCPGHKVGLVTSLRESYWRRRLCSSLHIMIGGGFWAVEPDGYCHDGSLLDDPRYCWWCRSPLGPYESDMQGNPVCEECERWYEHAHCYWCWDWAEFWYFTAFHLPLCGRCLRLHLDGSGPPWYPNFLQRRELHLRWLFVAQARGSRYALPGVVCDLVAGFLAPIWRP